MPHLPGACLEPARKREGVILDGQGHSFLPRAYHVILCCGNRHPNASYFLKLSSRMNTNKMRVDNLSQIENAQHLKEPSELYNSTNFPYFIPGITGKARCLQQDVFRWPKGEGRRHSLDSVSDTTNKGRTRLRNESKKNVPRGSRDASSRIWSLEGSGRGSLSSRSIASVQRRNEALPKRFTANESQRDDLVHTYESVSTDLSSIERLHESLDSVLSDLTNHSSTVDEGEAEIAHQSPAETCSSSKDRRISPWVKSYKLQNCSSFRTFHSPSSVRSDVLHEELRTIRGLLRAHRERSGLNTTDCQLRHVQARSTSHKSFFAKPARIQKLKEAPRATSESALLVDHV